MVKHILTEAVALHAFSPAAEHIKRLPEPLIRERLDQIIHRAQSHGIVNRFCVIRRCDHDDIRVHTFRTKLQQQLSASLLLSVCGFRNRNDERAANSRLGLDTNRPVERVHGLLDE